MFKMPWRRTGPTEQIASRSWVLISWSTLISSHGSWRSTWVPLWHVTHRWTCPSSRTSWRILSIWWESNDLTERRNLWTKSSTEWRVSTTKGRSKTLVTVFKELASHQTTWWAKTSTVVSRASKCRISSKGSLMTTLLNTLHSLSLWSKHRTSNIKNTSGKRSWRTREEATSSESTQPEEVTCTILSSSSRGLTIKLFTKSFLAMKFSKTRASFKYLLNPRAQDPRSN